MAVAGAFRLDCCPPVLGRGLPGGVIRLLMCLLRVSRRAAVGELHRFVAVCAPHPVLCVLLVARVQVGLYGCVQVF